jgi:SAM-dependent methyltransferase
MEIMDAADSKLSADAESTRVREVFDKRMEINRGPFDLYALCAHQERQEALARFFRRIGLLSLKDVRILDIGCGSGGNLRRMIDFGAQPQNCFGIDLFRKSLLGGHAVNPGIVLLEGTAEKLPFGDAQFDFVFQFTVLTSVLDAKSRRAIVNEVSRTLRKGGYFVWYDFAYSNPKNANVRGIGRREIAKLLSGYRLEFKKITLAPPIGRRAVKVSPAVYRVLAALPFLRSHYFCFAEKL